MVKKERTPSYLSPTALVKAGLLDSAEYERYKENRQKIQAMNLRERGNELSSEENYRRGLKTYGKSRSGRFSNVLSKGFRVASQPHGVTRTLYQRQGQLPPTNVENRFRTIQGIKSGKRGRPAGTLDKRYAAYGGVYGYRKAMALERFKQRQAILQARAVTPQQQAILNQMRMRDEYARSNPEAQIIPDTRGDVFLDGIMDEINRASNIIN